MDVVLSPLQTFFAIFNVAPVSFDAKELMMQKYDKFAPFQGDAFYE